MRYTIHADGGARGNPGPAGAGAIVHDEHDIVVHQVSEYLGLTTNNVAEYTALVRALEGLAAIAGKKDDVVVKMDSELVIKQMRGEYRVKHPNLKPLFLRATALVQQFKSVTFTHVRREENGEADRLANDAMDRGA